MPSINHAQTCRQILKFDNQSISDPKQLIAEQSMNILKIRFHRAILSQQKICKLRIMSTINELKFNILSNTPTNRLQMRKK